MIRRRHTSTVEGVHELRRHINRNDGSVKGTLPVEVPEDGPGVETELQGTFHHFVNKDYGTGIAFQASKRSEFAGVIYEVTDDNFALGSVVTVTSRK